MLNEVRVYTETSAPQRPSRAEAYHRSLVFILEAPWLYFVANGRKEACHTTTFIGKEKKNQMFG